MINWYILQLRIPPQLAINTPTVQITVIFIDFRVCDFAFDASYIAHYSSNGYATYTSHIIAQMDLTSGFGNISLE